MSQLELDIPDPALLVDRTTPRELLATIRKIGEWTERRLAAVDLLLTVWSSRAIARTNDREGIAELQRIVHVLESSTIPEMDAGGFPQRWRAISDMLEARRRNLAGADPASQMQRKHVADILQKLAAAEPREYRQADLAEELEITAGRMTQILGPLEAHGLIARRKHGQASMLTLTDKGRDLAPTRRSAASIHRQRGAEFLALPKAA